jgi:nucleotide-binding universal stress UspA family protein
MTIVAAVDKPEQSQKVLQEAKQLADAFDDSLQIVHVVAYDDTDLDIGVAAQETDDRMVTIAKDQVHEIVGDSVAEYEAVGLFGDEVAPELLEYLEDVDVRYLVIGGRRRSPVGKALFGSTAQKLLLNAEFPVVSVQ